MVIEPQFAFDKRPEKRCDVCLVRRAKIRADKMSTIQKIQKRIEKIEGQIAWREERKRTIEPELVRHRTMLRESIRSIADKGYAELCPYCSNEPRIVVIKEIRNKVYDVPNELCMDCPIQYKSRCTFMEDAPDDKAMRRRERLTKKYGKLMLCV